MTRTLIRPQAKTAFIGLLAVSGLGFCIFMQFPQKQAPATLPTLDSSRVAPSPSVPLKNPPPVLSHLNDDSQPPSSRQHDLLEKLARSQSKMTSSLEALKLMKMADKELDQAMKLAAQKRKEVTSKILYQEEMQHLSESDLAKIAEANQLEEEASHIHAQKLLQAKDLMTSTL